MSVIHYLAKKITYYGWQSKIAGDKKMPFYMFLKTHIKGH